LILFHRIHSSKVKAIRFFSSDLPKLVLLYIGFLVLPTNQEPMTFPVLETLYLDGRWSNLWFIAAPKLRNLVLTFRGEEPEEVTMSALRRSPVRPMSLSIDFFPDTYLLELLKLWSNLSEIHLRGRINVCIPGSIITTALAGRGAAAPLCPSLRYLTVHVKEGWKDPKMSSQSIQRLQRIVKKRKGYGVIGLQRVMCVWGHDNGNEVQWVDVL
jgi:hypothetical protein